MAALTLDYRHCSRKRPLYPKHAEVEAIALMARQQLIQDKYGIESTEANNHIYNVARNLWTEFELDLNDI